MFAAAPVRGGNGANIATLLIAALALAMPVVSALAQSSSASYQIPRESTDAGAGPASSASFTVHGTIGQPDAGAAMGSASYTLRGGFHIAAPAAPPSDALFADGFEAN